MRIHKPLALEFLPTMVVANEPPFVMDLKHVFFVLGFLLECEFASDLILAQLF